MRRFELGQGSSRRFWEIELDRMSFSTRDGKLGTKGRASVETFYSESRAFGAYKKAIRAKQAAGYLEVDPAAPASVAPDGARNVDLELALHEDFDDDDAWRVYGDWLQTRGDPRGELLSLESRYGTLAHDDEHRPRVDDLIRELSERHRNTWMGPRLAELVANPSHDDDVISLAWRRGFIVAATADRRDAPADADPLTEILTVLVSSPAARFLHRLNIGLPAVDATTTLEPLVDALCSQGELWSLRELCIGDFERDQAEISWVTVGDVSLVFLAAPRLRRLRIRGAGVELGDVEHSVLESLVIESGGLPASAIHSVAAARLPQLRELELWFGSHDYGSEGDATMLAPLLSGERFPRLRTLGLKNAEFSDALIDSLVCAGLLARLEVLDLSMGTISDSGARTLLDHADALGHLRCLDLRENHIRSGVSELRAVFGDKLRIDEQKVGPPYYVSVGE